MKSLLIAALFISSAAFGAFLPNDSYKCSDGSSLHISGEQNGMTRHQFSPAYENPAFPQTFNVFFNQGLQGTIRNHSAVSGNIDRIGSAVLRRDGSLVLRVGGKSLLCR